MNLLNSMRRWVLLVDVLSCVGNSTVAKNEANVSQQEKCVGPDEWGTGMRENESDGTVT